MYLHEEKENYDVEHSTNEDRYNTIGMVHDVLFVVYTERKENIRLIEKSPAIFYKNLIFEIIVYA